MVNGHAPAALAPGKKTQIPVVNEAAWAPGPVWADKQNLASNRDSITRPFSPYRVAKPNKLSRPTQVNVANTRWFKYDRDKL